VSGVAPGNIALLSPLEPGFWAHVTAQAEFRDGAADALDRWSRRVITNIATAFGGQALFPFAGPPWHPFTSWALASGQFHTSPVTLLVHPRMGLWTSFRGAISFNIELTGGLAENPCDSCATKPCLTACPPRALTADGYDLPACHDFLDQDAGQTCLNRGCLVRAACPLSQSYGRLAAQSAHHMRHFHP
jgi:hypothetical protein